MSFCFLNLLFPHCRWNQAEWISSAATKWTQDEQREGKFFPYGRDAYVSWSTVNSIFKVMDLTPWAWRLFSYVLLQISTSMEGLHKELSEKKSELRRVQDELSRRDKEHVSDGSLQSLRNMLMALQKENSNLKVWTDRANTMNIWKLRNGFWQHNICFCR